MNKQLRNQNKAIRSFGLGVLVAMFAVQTCSGYERMVDLNGHESYWDDSDIPVGYWINDNWWTDAELASLNSSFQTWQDVETSYLAFSSRGLTDYNVIGLDGYNMCGWARLSDFGLSPGTVAVTMIFLDNTSGRIQDTDIVFDLDERIIIGSEPCCIDFQTVATHEIGHIVGLDDLYSESDVGKMMYGIIERGEIRRTLSEDDKNGTSAIYPVPEDSGGGPCFIATAVYGTALADDVRALCLFRDRHLQTNRVGRSVISVYCRLSPPVADLIAKNEFLKVLVRMQLRPLILGSRLICFAAFDAGGRRNEN